jgi:hypothetical protein
MLDVGCWMLDVEELTCLAGKSTNTALYIAAALSQDAKARSRKCR